MRTSADSGAEPPVGKGSHHSALLSDNHIASRSPRPGSSTAVPSIVNIFPQQTITISPELVEPQPGPDYQRMDSPVPSSIPIKSYVSRAFKWVREFNSLPWVAGGPITVEYGPAPAESNHVYRRPLLAWENKRLKHVLRHSPEVDLTAGESPPVSIRHPSATFRSSPAPDRPSYYTNENGQIWPVVVASPQNLSPPALCERESSLEYLPHANGVLRPMTPPPLHASPGGTWRVEGNVPPPSWINYHTPSPPVTLLAPDDRDSVSIREATRKQDATVPPGNIDVREPSQSVPLQSPAQVRSPRVGGLVVSGNRPPSSPPSRHSSPAELSTPRRRSLLRRARCPLPPIYNSVGRTPRRVSNLGSHSPESQSQGRASIGESQNIEDSVHEPRRSNGLRSSWVEIVNVNTRGTDSGSTALRQAAEDRDLQIARALQLEDEGIADSDISTLPVPPVLLSRSSIPFQRTRDENLNPSSSSTSNFPLVPHTRPQPPLIQSHIVPASSHGFHTDIQLSSTSPALLNHPYSGYVSVQPPASEEYGQPVHAGHNGYVSSIVHSNARTRTQSRSGSSSRR
ncbi:hypothetical protein E1B28_006253 [Marasmius oreades]|uniref:Uncharacterized protein n=1 Tax=Marasmius oreades TaxID=181124 RepID=A0A9P7S5G5_9AGAR|nr:uncharacterized protein E1B28_006253 [Marasmius oreades]KAG7095515.1 hypothetical protein E1B28_006253 [Marasmius oreades]